MHVKSMVAQSPPFCGGGGVVFGAVNVGSNAVPVTCNHGSKLRGKGNSFYTKLDSNPKTVISSDEPIYFSKYGEINSNVRLFHLRFRTMGKLDVGASRSVTKGDGWPFLFSAPDLGETRLF
ncbi:hypothetical protein TNCV_3910161 [Trichonephila clavipes]|nr:hypothetical protein TNCV_3910161 [Trichonephila clavipes]